MHDMAALEKAGVISVGLLSSGFVAQARYQAAKLGFEDAAQVFVAHPVSDQTYERYMLVTPLAPSHIAMSFYAPHLLHQQRQAWLGYPCS